MRRRRKTFQVVKEWAVFDPGERVVYCYKDAVPVEEAEKTTDPRLGPFRGATYTVAGTVEPCGPEDESYVALVEYPNGPRFLARHFETKAVFEADAATAHESGREFWWRG